MWKSFHSLILKLLTAGLDQNLHLTQNTELTCWYERVVWRELPRKPEVYEHEVHGLRTQQDVVGLDVLVQHVLLLQVDERLQNLPEVLQ